MTDQATASRTDLDVLGALAGVGYFRVDRDRKITAVSPELTRMTGFSEEEVLGQTCLSLLRCPSCLRGCGVFENDRVQDVRLGIFRKDGTEIQVERSGICLRDEDGEITGALETVRLLEGSEEAAGTPAAVEALMSGLGRLFIAADDDFRIRTCSEMLGPLLETTAEELVGRSLAELLGEELFGPQGELRRAVEAGQRKEGWRAYLPGPSGPIPISLSIGPIGGDNACGHRDVRMVIMIRREDEAESAPAKAAAYHGIVGRSRAMQRIFRLVDLMAESDSTVLITGESGTGKELLARAIHDTSRRSQGPFVAVNCAALPSELLESELFGHVRGAFTGAVRDRAGRFEAAEGGTLFLDEIGDLDPALQGKILRALQDGTFERVGESRTRRVDVRVVAATHVDLEKAVAERRFRDDLYYRLRVIPIHVPPLRERREDLPALITHVLDRLGGRHRRALRLSPNASRALLSHPWPGNVRELENALEFAMTVCGGQTIHVGDLPPEIHAQQSPEARDPVGEGPEHERVVEAGDTGAGRRDLPPEAGRIQAALVECRFHRSATAESLGISRTTLWRKMREYGL